MVTEKVKTAVMALMVIVLILTKMSKIAIMVARTIEMKFLTCLRSVISLLPVMPGETIIIIPGGIFLFVSLFPSLAVTLAQCYRVIDYLNNV